jgi:tRNA pseudouridine55 synthase
MKNEHQAGIVTRQDIEKCLDEDEFALLDRMSQGAIILVDKPKGWTSFDIVNKIKKSFKIKKVGHAGTLDPMATGLLIICTAGKTKEISLFVDLDKTYTGIIKLGESTASYDADTEVTEKKPFSHITEYIVRDTVSSMTGTIDQVPPMYSAVKKNGKPLYKLARKGVEIDRESRKVTIYEFEVTDVAIPFVTFRIRCSKGTYIRSIAHDFGSVLKTGGHLTELRRTAIGSFSVNNAVSVDQVNELRDRLKRKYV